MKAFIQILFLLSFFSIYNINLKTLEGDEIKRVDSRFIYHYIEQTKPFQLSFSAKKIQLIGCDGATILLSNGGQPSENGQVVYHVHPTDKSAVKFQFFSLDSGQPTIVFSDLKGRLLSRLTIIHIKKNISHYQKVLGGILLFAAFLFLSSFFLHRSRNLMSTRLVMENDDTANK